MNDAAEEDSTAGGSTTEDERRRSDRGRGEQQSDGPDAVQQP